jgi:hypothetical protein
MDAFKNWLATTPLGSAFKVFLGVLFGAVILTWSDEGQISFDHWQTWVIGALVVAVPIIINWLNSADTRYGRGSNDVPK